MIGSRFLSHGYHRVLYFWHSVGNRMLTLLSNMLTDLNLSDMETCYKVFKREVIQSVDLKRIGSGSSQRLWRRSPTQGLRIYEMGISYRGRTYAEGKKIGMKDAWRALYCILHYNLPLAPAGIQLAFYSLAGGIAAVVNLAVFLALFRARRGHDDLRAHGVLSRRGPQLRLVDRASSSVIAYATRPRSRC